MEDVTACYWAVRGNSYQWQVHPDTKCITVSEISLLLYQTAKVRMQTTEQQQQQHKASVPNTGFTYTLVNPQLRPSQHERPPKY
jgi:hypothetical protein